MEGKRERGGREGERRKRTFRAQETLKVFFAPSRCFFIFSLLVEFRSRFVSTEARYSPLPPLQALHQQRVCAPVRHSRSAAARTPRRAEGEALRFGEEERRLLPASSLD